MTETRSVGEPWPLCYCGERTVFFQVDIQVDIPADIPVFGGLMIGLMAKYGSERIRGHGIPEAIEAILLNGSRVQPRVAVLKPLSSAISIGSGGPFGAEGPIIVTGGSIGSLLGQVLTVSPAERKILLAVANRPIDTNPTFTRGGDVSRFQRNTVPAAASPRRPSRGPRAPSGPAGRSGWSVTGGTRQAPGSSLRSSYQAGTSALW